MSLPKQPYHNLSHSLLIRPNVHFEIQRPHEIVVLIARQHPLTQLSWITNATLLFILSFVGNFFLINFLSPAQVLVFDLFAGIFLFAYIWLNFLLWYFSVGIVTNERILDLDFYNIVYKEFTATTLSEVSELTTKVAGFFGSVFNFGDVFIKTEGFEQNIEFQKVPKPSVIVRIINDLNIQSPEKQ